jgi:hypothetical protein
MMDSAPGTSSPAGTTGHRVCLRWWFVWGFLLVFIGMLLFVHSHTMLPSGGGIVSVSLWQHYLIEARRTFSSSDLGPISGGGSAAMMTFFQHVLCAALGGAAMLGIGFAAGKLKDRH